jgi:hypothetical protein
MARRIRLLSRNTIRQRQQLRLLTGIALLSSVVGVFTYLYFWVSNIQLARAAAAESLKVEGRIIMEGYQGRLKINLNTSITPLDDAVPICLKLKIDPLKNIRYGGNVISDEANDICVTASDGGTLLKSSIERYHPQTGQIVLWIYPDARNRKISNSIYLYYGNKIEARGAKSISKSTFYKGIWNFNGTFDAHGLEYVFGEIKGVKDEEGLFSLAKSFLSVERSAAVFDAGKDMEFSGTLSLSVWIKPQTVLKEQTLFTNETLTGGCRLYINKMGRICFKMVDSDGHVSLIDRDTGGSSLSANEWVHVAAVYDASAQQIHIYVNGKLDREKSVSTQYAAGKLIIFGANADLKHGFYNGLMDEFRITDKALSHKQINDIYNTTESKTTVTHIETEKLSPNDGRLSLERFTFKPIGNTIQVEWTTKNEYQLDYFILERSADTFKCAEVTKVLSKGSLVRYQRYSANDTAPIEGTSFYRLRYVWQNYCSDSSAWQVVNYNPVVQSFID